MKNQLIEKPKSAVLLYREVISGAWKNWTDNEVEVNLSSLKNSRKICISILQDDLQGCVKEEILYDHKKITEAIQMIEGLPFDGHIEPKYVNAPINPYIIQVPNNEFRRETVEPVNPKLNIPFLVFCLVTVLGVLIYISIP